LSRVGKKPVVIPADMKVEVNGKLITFSRGKKSATLDTQDNVSVKFENNSLIFSSLSESRQDRACWGTYRALAQSTVTGLVAGFEKRLEINGVGYKAALKGSILELQLGYSHPINFTVPAGIEINLDKNIIIIKGSDKQLVGQVSANIRSYREPEPYKGKGIKYTNEKIIRKAGKTSKK
jgi:large subunit ribosomal protein L6